MHIASTEIFSSKDVDWVGLVAERVATQPEQRDTYVYT